MRANLPDKGNFLGKTILEYPSYVIKEHVDSGSHGHLFRAENESIDSSLAFKIVPTANLSSYHDDTYLQEAKKANVLDNSAVVRYHDVIRHTDIVSGMPCIIFICDYVDGKSLQFYINTKAHHDRVDVPFITAFLSTMFGLLFELERRGLTHGDLHAGNVLVVKSPYDIADRPAFRVTDFGVRQLSGSAAHASDFLNVASTLADLLNVINYDLLDSRSRFVFERLRDDFLRRYLIETDYTADPVALNPRALNEQLESIDRSYDQVIADGRKDRSLTTPFDYPNCEQIGDSHILLHALYSDRLLGLSDIPRRSNVVLTGPRGCGKTTVFRALSLDYRVATDGADPKTVQYIGIYYRCDDLYFSFPRYAKPQREDMIDIPMHYLTSALLGLALENLAKWASRHFRDEWERRSEALVEGLYGLFDWSSPQEPTARDLRALASRLKGKERDRAARDARYFHRTELPGYRYFGPDVLANACKVICEHFSFLVDRPFIFFIDDFSRPKITVDLQANLNRLLMHRSPNAFFKISTESPVSFARHDVDGKRFVESREYDFINLGLRYINDPRSGKTMSFLDDLFERRFNAVESYPVRDLTQLLGSAPRQETATARVIRGEGSDADKAHGLYAGKETIARMCSGDIHYVIRLVGRMVDDVGLENLSTGPSAGPAIARQRQNAMIRHAAGEFIDQLSRVPGRGPELAKVVTAIGNVAHSYLRYRTSKNGPDRPPHQASRIEPLEALDLLPGATEILDDLLRYSVLIEDSRGKSRRGDVVRRFYLRRYLIPHFRLTFSHRDSLELGSRDIERLLLTPEEFEREYRVRSSAEDGRTTDLLDHPDRR